MSAGTNPARLISTFGGTSFKPSDYSAINNDGILSLKRSGMSLAIGNPSYNAATYADGGNYFQAQVVRGLLELNFVKGMGGSGDYTVSGFQRHPRHVGLLFGTSVDGRTLSDGPGFTISGVTFSSSMHTYYNEDGDESSHLIVPCYDRDAYRSGTVIQVSAPTTYGGAGVNLYELLGA